MIAVCRVEDVPLGEGRAVTVDGRRVAVFHTAQGWYALDHACPHRGGPLADGLLSDCAVTCPLHERRFDLRTGDPVRHDGEGVRAYPVLISDGEVFVGSVHGARPPLVLAG